MTVPKSLQFDVIDGALLREQLVKAQLPVDAVPTPFPAWNSACRDEGGGEGLALGWHVIIAGGTGGGKSLVALGCAVSAMNAGEAVCYVSLEMSQTQLVTRVMAIATGNSVRCLERGKSFDLGVARTTVTEFEAARERSGGSIRVNRYPLRDLSDIDMVFGYYTSREKCSVFIVDYLQLAWVGHAKDKLDAITEVSHAVRMRAREHNVLTIGLSQFNRQTSGNRIERPTVEGLMGSSSLENDGDQVMLLDHTSYVRQGAAKAEGKLLLAKNRHGPQVEIPVDWNYQNLQVWERDAVHTREPGEEAA